MSDYQRELIDLKRQAEAATGLDPVDWAQGLSTVDYELDEWQAAYLRSQNLRAALLCSRQVGKSATTALKAGWIVKHGGMAMVISPTERQSGLLFQQIREHLKADGESFVRETATFLQTENGGKAYSLPGNRPSQIRGFSLRHWGPSALIVDEAAFVRESLWPVISPMMSAAPNAGFYVLSTPSGPGNEFHRIWESGGEAWGRVKVTADDCPRISAEFLEQEKARLGPLFDQEYLCAFIATGNQFFSPDLIDGMFETDGASVAEQLVNVMFAGEDAA